MYPKELFRVKGGNQRMTDALAARLGARVRLGCPVTKIVREESAVTVHCQEFGEDRKMEAEYLVNAIPLPVFNKGRTEVARLSAEQRGAQARRDLLVQQITAAVAGAYEVYIARMEALQALRTSVPQGPAPQMTGDSEWR